MTNLPPVRSNNDTPRADLPQAAGAHPPRGLVHDDFSQEEEAGFRYPEPDPNSPHGRALAALRAAMATSENNTPKISVPDR